MVTLTIMINTGGSEGPVTNNHFNALNKTDLWFPLDFSLPDYPYQQDLKFKGTDVIVPEYLFSIPVPNPIEHKI